MIERIVLITGGNKGLAIVYLATLPPDGPTGQFFDRHGALPW